MRTVFKKMMVFCVVMALVMGILPAGKTAEAAAKGYMFKYKGVSVSADSAAKKLLKKAGKPLKTKVCKSCAYPGKDRNYAYKDFALYTYSKTNNGPEYVQQIIFLTKNVKTKEGLKIGSKENQIVKKYGKGYDKADKSIDNTYTYKKGNCTLQIKVKKQKVTGITYMQTKVTK